MIKKIILAGIYQMREAAKDLSIIGFNEVKKSIAHKGSYKPYRKKAKTECLRNLVSRQQQK